MVSDKGDRCCCGAFCRRLFCRGKPPEETVEDDESMPITLLQLAEAREVRFTLPLTEPLSIGAHIVCTGTPIEDIPWFALNIGCGDAESGHADVAVHFNVRMPQCYVVRNTKKGGKWASEETTSYRMFPFKTGRPFTIEVLVDEKETLWAVDGKPYCTYAHRVPSPFNASWVQVAGIKDATLNIEKTDVYPVLAPPVLEVPVRSSFQAPAEDEPAWCPNLIASLPHGLPDGHQIVISGRLRPMLHSFTVELLDRAHEWPAPNVLAHASLRAHDEAQLDRQLVVLNAWLGGWGAERRQRTARLVPGTKTTFRILRSPDAWLVYADDMLIGELEYRASPNGVRAVRVRGDLYPDEIYVCPSSSSPTQ